MLHKCLHLFTALGCLQTILSPPRAQGWQTPDLRAVQWCWHGAVSRLSVCPLLSPLIGEMGQTTPSQPSVQLWAPPAQQDSAIATTWAQPWPALFPGNGWGKGKTVPAENANRQGWGQKALWAERGAACWDRSPVSQPAPFVELEQ